jgi:hypothetical protein
MDQAAPLRLVIGRIPDRVLQDVEIVVKEEPYLPRPAG